MFAFSTAIVYDDEGLDDYAEEVSSSFVEAMDSVEDLGHLAFSLSLWKQSVMEVDKCFLQTCTADLENYCVLQEDGLVFPKQNYALAKDHRKLFYAHHVKEVVVLLVERLAMDVGVLQVPAACAFQ